MDVALEQAIIDCREARRRLAARRRSASRALRRVRPHPAGPGRGWADGRDGRGFEALVADHRGLARALAARYARRGEAAEDLEQVAMMALVKAAKRWDPDRGVPFAGYATPSILGELKRHFRDRAWAMRVPRSTQERYLRVVAERDSLTQQRGMVPTVEAVAESIGCSTEDVLEAMEAGDNFRPTSIEALGASARAELPSEDGGYQVLVDHVGLASAMTHLDEEERRILALRFVDEWPQRRIASELGVSQMHVSRLLARLLVRLRADLRD